MGQADLLDYYYKIARIFSAFRKVQHKQEPKNTYEKSTIFSFINVFLLMFIRYEVVKNSSILKKINIFKIVGGITMKTMVQWHKT